MMPLKEDEEYIIPEKESYSEMLKLLNSNQIVNKVDVGKRIIFKIPEILKTKEEKHEKNQIKQNLRNQSFHSLAIQSTATIELN